MSATPTPDPSQQAQPTPPPQSGGAHGFFSSLIGQAHESIAQQQANFEANKQKDIDMYTQELLKPPIPGEDPDAAAARRQKIADTITKVRGVGTGSNKPFQSMVDTLNAVHRHVIAPAQQAATASPASGTQPQPLPSGDVLNAQAAPSGVLTDPDATGATPTAAASVHPSVTPAASLPPLSLGQHLKNIAANIGVGLAHGTAGVLNVADKLLVPPTPPQLPSLDPTLIRQAIPPALKFDTSNAVEGNSFGPDDVDRLGQPIDANKKYYLAPDVYGKITTPDGRHFTAEPVEAVAKTVNMRPVYATQGGIDLANAAQLEASGHPFHTPSGEVIKVADIPAGMKLYPVTIGGQSGYGLASERQVKEQGGNMNYVTGEFDLNNPSTYTAVGPTRVPTLHGAPGMTASGVPGTVVTSSTPSTPGVTGAPKPTGLPTLSPGAQIAGGPNAPATGTVQPPAAAAAPGQPPPKHLSGGDVINAPLKTPPAASGSGKSDREQMMPLAQARQFQMLRTPIQEGSVQIFGSPRFPNADKMEDFSDLPNNKDEWMAASTVLNAILDNMNDAIQNQGGIWTAAKNAGGVTAAMQQAQTAVIGNQLDNLPDHARDYVNTALTALSMLVGMRAANKGSAAQFSVKSLANDIPSLTHGVKTQRDFYDKLGKLGVAVSTAMHNVGGFSDEDRNYIDSETNRLQAMAKQKAPTAGTNGQPQSLADRLNDALGKKK